MAWVAWHKARLQLAGLVCAIALLSPNGATAEESTSKQSFIWTVPAFAPAFITDGGKLSGYAAYTQNWFAAHLPQYRYSVLHVPLARLLAEMKSGEGAVRCSAALIPTAERRSYIAFAKTVLLHLPISVVIQAADEERFAPYLDAKGHVELDKLLADEQLLTAVRSGRAYGARVDKHLNRYRDAKHVMQVVDDTKFLRMLDLKRIDWTLYFPSEAEYYRRQTTPDLEIKTLPISGNTTLLEATIGCAKTPLGEKAISEINAIINQNPTMPWTEFYADWLAPEDRQWFYAARDQYIHSEHFETRLEYKPSSTQ